MARIQFQKVDKKDERRLVLEEVVATLSLCHRSLMVLYQNEKVWDPKEKLLKEINHIYGSMIELDQLK
jgi:hypothetical protein